MEERAMRQPHVDDLVRLTRDIPELQLKQGDVGIVCSTWFAPNETYEVEFCPTGLNCNTRALLLAEQLQVEEQLNQAALQV
jgi:Domain of unknown function (DUF4926)